MKGARQILTVFFLLFLAGGILHAQPGNKVEALRASFISKKLDLSSSEAEKFWPLYNEYNDKIRTIKRNLRQAYRKPVEHMSDSEVEELSQYEVKSKQLEAELHTQYSAKMKNIIGARKMVLLRQAEEEFKRELLENIKDKNE
jgi:hypothetical protein